MRRALALGSLAAFGAAAVVLGAWLGAGTGLGAVGSHVTASQTFTVNVDGRNPSVNESFNAYFPSDVKVHAGDTVVFHYVGVGTPHSVTLGTLADAADVAYNKLTPAQQQNPPKSFLATDAKLPQLINQHGGAVVPSGGNPCVLGTGVPSGSAPCPSSAAPAFDGSQSYYNSGWLKANERYTVHLSPMTPPGTYRFLCLFHREFMQGAITVVSASTAVPSPAAQAAVGRAELAKDEAQLAGAAKLLAAGKPPIPGLTLPGPHPILTGSGNPGFSGGEIDQFGPRTVDIPVGGSVTWWLVGLHSITFDSNNSDNDIQTVYKNGDVQINQHAAAPAGGPGEPAHGPSGGSPSHIDFKVVASGSWDGKGFHNSGVFGNSEPPNIEGYKLTFTHVGTYKFICTVHDNMKGTIVVGGG